MHLNICNRCKKQTTFFGQKLIGRIGLILSNAITLCIGAPQFCTILDFGLNATKPVFGVSKKRDLNQPPQLQRLARKFKFCKFRYDTFQKANNKGE